MKVLLQKILAISIVWVIWSFPGSSEGKECACNAGDPGSILGLGRYCGEGNGNPLQYSCLENSVNRGACGLPSMGLQRVRYYWVTNTFTLMGCFSQFSSVTQSSPTVCNPIDCSTPHFSVQKKKKKPPKDCSNSCLSSWWSYPNISSSLIPFSSCLQSLPEQHFFSESVLNIR